jgi:hypothetical protein
MAALARIPLNNFQFKNYEFIEEQQLRLMVIADLLFAFSLEQHAVLEPLNNLSIAHSNA